MADVRSAGAAGPAPTQEIQEGRALFRGRIVPLAEANVSIATHALNYGTGCFEGIRAYWNEEQQQLFVLKLRDHYRRFLSSCSLVRIECRYTLDELCDITLELLRQNNLREDTYIRPIAFKASQVIKVTLEGLRDEVAVFCAPMGNYVSVSGLSVQVSAWQRISDNAVPSRSKTTGSYVNTALAVDQAKRDGYDDAILLNRDGHVAEASGANLFVVRGGKLVTPAVTEDILEGITRQAVRTLAARLGLEVVERTIDRTELYVCDEAFLVGTGAQVAPIVSVDRRPVGDGKVGPIVQSLQEAYFRAVRGDDPECLEWLDTVY